MKWEKYNQLGTQDKEEYQYKFTKIFNLMFDLEVLTFLCLILVIQTYQLTKEIFLLETLKYIVFGIWLIILVIIFTKYKEYKWLKNKGV
jgi:hypothetical protein